VHFFSPAKTAVLRSVAVSLLVSKVYPREALAAARWWPSGLGIPVPMVAKFPAKSSVVLWAPTPGSVRLAMKCEVITFAEARVGDLVRLQRCQPPRVAEGGR
jgi:hypothetical protein